MFSTLLQAVMTQKQTTFGVWSLAQPPSILTVELASALSLNQGSDSSHLPLRSEQLDNSSSNYYPEV